MTNLEIAKQIIAENIAYAECGIYDTQNLTGDEMTALYRGNELQIDICYDWEYFEVFGLTDEEFYELIDYYGMLLGKKEDE